MGIINLFKSIKSEYKKIRHYMDMSLEELSALNDEELRECLSIKMTGAERRLDVSECLSTFTGAKKLYYIVNYFDMEVQNGGLCQYFVNSSRETAPYLLESLKDIQAVSYYNLLSNFITKYEINLHSLDSFMIEDIEEYEKQLERYPFDEFDDAYYEIYEEIPLENLLFNHCKNNLKDFV